jgi:hypothetical protein
MDDQVPAGDSGGVRTSTRVELSTVAPLTVADALNRTSGMSDVDTKPVPTSEMLEPPTAGPRVGAIEATVVTAVRNA